MGVYTGQEIANHLIDEIGVSGCDRGSGKMAGIPGGQAVSPKRNVFNSGPRSRRYGIRFIVEPSFRISHPI
jgi:hypothetical protein